MHAQHAKPIGMICRKRAKPHQRACQRSSSQVLQFAQKFARFRAGVDNTATGVEDRALCIGKQFNCFCNRFRAANHLRFIAMRRRFGGALDRRNGDLHVFGNIDNNWARPTSSGDPESFFQSRLQIRRIFHQVVMLGAVARDAHGVGFLKCIGPDQRGRDLAGDNYQRDRIEKCIRNSGNGIGRTRP